MFQPVFGKSSDGHLTAAVGLHIFMMSEPRAGAFRVMSGYQFSRVKPIEDLKKSDFYGAGDEVAGEAGFKTYVHEYAHHLTQKEELGRREERSGIRTPWGQSQGMTVYAENGIVCHNTAGHGGFKVYAKFNREIPEPYRNNDGWYEEDSEWAKVALGLPAFFTDRELKYAEETVRNWYPDEFEAVNNVVIPEGRSHIKDERLFKERNADSWVVISAVRSDDDRSMVKCYATKGGERGGWNNGVETNPESREFLVPAAEYETRSRYGFVIDEDRHTRTDEPAMGMGR